MRDMKETLSVSEAADAAETIEEIIMTYCEGYQHLEFDKENLPAMVEKITQLVCKRVLDDNIKHGSYAHDVPEAINLIKNMK